MTGGDELPPSRSVSMLALSKKIDYALIGLACLADRDSRYVSAREIAEANDLPAPVLMQILKALHNRGVLRSTRGVKGGYQIDMNLDQLSLLSLSEMLEGCDDDQPGVKVTLDDRMPLKAIREKLAQFLRDVRVSEVISPGRKIDVPLERVRIVERLEKISV